MTKTTSAVTICALILGTGCGSPRATDGRAVEAPADASGVKRAPVDAGPARSTTSRAHADGSPGSDPVANSRQDAHAEAVPDFTRLDDAREKPPTSADVASISAPADRPLERVELVVPGTTSTLVLVPIPAGEVRGVDGATTRVAPFLASTTEITWDMYDAFVAAMDRAETEKDPPDAFARPSKPYITMDRGFGHAGYPVISVSYRGANEFCRWLSHRTGRRFRLPTEVEWQHAAGAADPSQLDAIAWHQANSKARGRLATHPVGKKAANAHGLHDVHGNAAEWTTGPDGKGVLRGGSFKDSAAALAERRPDDPSFNATDPQIPKSVWWLADGPFAGFRVVREP